jgi:hypothetical protein
MNELNTPQDQDKTPKHTDESENGSTLGNVTLPIAESPTSPSEQCHPYTYQHSPKPWWKRIDWKLIVELFVLGVGIKVACIYSGQLNQMIESNKITCETFETAARPYIVIDNIQKAEAKTGVRIFCSSNLEQICVRIYYTVTGQTPAIAVQREVHVLFEKDQKAAEDTITNWNPKSIESPEGFPPMSTRGHTWDDPVEETVPLDQADLLLRDKGTVYVYGAIKYRDLLKHRHVTRFCFIQSVIPHCPKAGCFADCEFGNYIDKSGDVPTQEEEPCHGKHKRR